ncbi:hypothetical protein PPO43_02940 [Saprospira sp. CCB-QB6]|uniref:hypothetical protein n=1 Tax=Saprospira sp. CCB-QB6 TaxID=3023936 RepID=UPI00234B3AD8|nr:hypothetical protein [Saprospira sp. CCB-QB6]WCL82057.1 hypothetical protein PPO43_02940 [Saprospira sp. CCB-QB6]
MKKTSLFLVALSLASFFVACQEKEQPKATPVKQESADSSQQEQPKKQKGIDEKYRKWMEAQFAAGKACPESDCNPETWMKKIEAGEEACNTGLADLAPKWMQADINGDGIMDAVANVPLLQCDGGKSQATAVHLLVFLSDGQGDFAVLDDPSILRKGASVERIDSLFADGRLQMYYGDFEEADPLCCPSVEERQQFKYEAGLFKLLK